MSTKASSTVENTTLQNGPADTTEEKPQLTILVSLVNRKFRTTQYDLSCCVYFLQPQKQDSALLDLLGDISTAPLPTTSVAPAPPTSNSSAGGGLLDLLGINVQPTTGQTSQTGPGMSSDLGLMDLLGGSSSAGPTQDNTLGKNKHIMLYSC